MAGRARRPTYVVDANVIVPFVLPEARSAEAARVFDAAQDGRVRLVAPSCWRIECANVVWKHAHRGLMDASDARAAFDLLDALPIASIDAALLMDVALDVALACNVTVYDALYVAAALYVEGPLVTDDAALANQAGNAVPELEVLSPVAFPKAIP